MAVDFNLEMQKAIEFRKNRPLRGVGDKPAVVVVDFQIGFTDGPRHGQDTLDSLQATAELLAVARDAKIPVVYLTVVYDHLTDVPLAWRAAEMGQGISRQSRGAEATAIHPIVASQVGDIIIEKYAASGFYGTDLHEKLQHLGVDTLLLVGTSTSGCVRATAVDASARSYRVQVVEDCVDDFRPISGEAALHDLAERYCDVIELKTAIEYLQQ